MDVDYEDYRQSGVTHKKSQGRVMQREIQP